MKNSSKRYRLSNEKDPMTSDSNKVKVDPSNIQYFVGLGMKSSLKSKLGEHQKQAIQTALKNPKEAHFHKLKGHTNLYSISYKNGRTNESRLLLTTDENRLVVLADLDKHQYDLMLQGKRKIHKQFLQNKHNEQKYEFEPLENSPFEVEEPSSDEELKFKPVCFERTMDGHAPKILSLDNGQQEALQLDLPALVAGMPGSGKTTLAIALVNLAQELKPNQKLLYVTESAQLVAQVKAEVEAQMDEALMDKIDIKSYAELIDKEQPYNHQQSFDEFSKWMKRQKKPSFKKLLAAYTEDNLYQELRLLCGYEKGAYLDKKNVGMKQRLIKEDETRVELYALYESWMRHLEAQPFTIPAFTAIPTDTTPYHVGIFDEIQDLSNLQTRSLVKLIDSNQIMMFDGHGQSLQDDNPKGIYCKRALDERNGQQLKLRKAVLPVAYRCPQLILELAALVYKVRSDLTPKGKQEIGINLSKRANLIEGQVNWAPDSGQSVANLRQALEGSPDACVITHHDLVHELMHAGIKAHQIFTPEQIKGLQFKDVFLYEPFFDKKFNDINKAMKEAQATPNAKYSSPLSQLFVSITRSQRNITIISSAKCNAKCHAFIKHLKTVHNKAAEPVHYSHVTTTIDTNAQAAQIQAKVKEWEEIAFKFWYSDNKRALDILKNELSFNEMQIETWRIRQELKKVVKPKPQSKPAPGYLTKVKPSAKQITPNKDRKIKSKQSKLNFQSRSASESDKPADAFAELIKHTLNTLTVACVANDTVSIVISAATIHNIVHNPLIQHEPGAFHVILTAIHMLRKLANKALFSNQMIEDIVKYATFDSIFTSKDGSKYYDTEFLDLASLKPQELMIEIIQQNHDLMRVLSQLFAKKMRATSSTKSYRPNSLDYMFAMLCALNGDHEPMAQVLQYKNLENLDELRAAAAEIKAEYTVITLAEEILRQHQSDLLWCAIFEDWVGLIKTEEDFPYGRSQLRLSTNPNYFFQAVMNMNERISDEKALEFRNIYKSEFASLVKSDNMEWSDAHLDDILKANQDFFKAFEEMEALKNSNRVYSQEDFRSIWSKVNLLLCPGGVRLLLNACQVHERWTLASYFTYEQAIELCESSFARFILTTDGINEILRQLVKDLDVKQELIFERLDHMLRLIKHPLAKKYSYQIAGFLMPFLFSIGDEFNDDRLNPLLSALKGLLSYDDVANSLEYFYNALLKNIREKHKGTLDAQRTPEVSKVNILSGFLFKCHDKMIGLMKHLFMTKHKKLSEVDITKLEAHDYGILYELVSRNDSTLLDDILKNKRGTIMSTAQDETPECFFVAFAFLTRGNNKMWNFIFYDLATYEDYMKYIVPHEGKLLMESLEVACGRPEYTPLLECLKLIRQLSDSERSAVDMVIKQADASHVDIEAIRDTLRARESFHSFVKTFLEHGGDTSARAAVLKANLETINFECYPGARFHAQDLIRKLEQKPSVYFPEQLTNMLTEIKPVSKNRDPRAYRETLLKQQPALLNNHKAMEPAEQLVKKTQSTDNTQKSSSLQTKISHKKNTRSKHAVKAKKKKRSAKKRR